jgi:uncharacterized damage-inducible protein DinB
MSVSAEVLTHHFEYSAWASRRLVEAAAQLSDDELTRDFGTSDRSVLGTLVHVFAADRVWYFRLGGGPNPGFSSDRDHSMAVLEMGWPPLYDRWISWARALTPEQISAPVSYTDLKGTPWKQPLWQLALHVVNHGTHHRGQVAGFLRSMGQTPPPLDLVRFYRDALIAKRAGL